MCTVNLFHANDKLSCDRDALSDLALHFLNKMKIMVVKEIEREEIEFICKVSLIKIFQCFRLHRTVLITL